VVAKYQNRYSLDPGLFYSRLDAMLDTRKPEAVLAFTNTFDHRSVVEACGRRGIHVMMEKPLAVSLEHATAMAKAARDGKIQVLVNYETTCRDADNLHVLSPGRIAQKPVDVPVHQAHHPHSECCLRLLGSGLQNSLFVHLK
jgi:hypothetical protein